MLAVRLDKDLEDRLAAVAQRTGRSKSHYVREALIEKLEELEDIVLLEEALRDPDAGKTIPFDDVMRDLGLDA